MPGTGLPGTRRRRPGYRGEALLALLPSLGVMLLVAGGAADRGVLYPLVLLSGSALGLGALLAIFPHGPQFLLGVANGLAMYACLFTVIGRAAFPAAPELTQALGFLLPVAVFVGACWWRRAGLARYARDGAADLNHLPRFARWLAVIGVVGVVSLSLPINRLSPPWQGVALLLAMAIIAVLTARVVGDVVRLLVDVAAIFQSVTARLGSLAVPIAAYTSLWALLAVVFGSLYRIADGLSASALFHGPEGPHHVSFADALHFSIVTLCSVGYGDIVPADDGIRVLCGMQMLASQLLLLFGFYEIMQSRQPDARRD